MKLRPTFTGFIAAALAMMSGSKRTSAKAVIASDKPEQKYRPMAGVSGRVPNQRQRRKLQRQTGVYT